jgi:pantoate--beta-alanine ligase
MSHSKSIGFVPTMGCLHAGHSALLKKAREDNDVVVLSIYVNKIQFNEVSDFDHYPRTLDADLVLAEKLGVDVVFLPSDEQMYADDQAFRLSSDHFWTTVAEGVARPFHFSGVLTVVMKLFLLVKATRVYFGEKDYQQLQLIDALAKAFFLELDVIPVATVREQSGLALSSRNRLLNPNERSIADRFATEFLKPTHSLESLNEALLLLPLQLEYLIEENGRWLVAVRVGSVRLIDNRALSAA